MLSKEEANEEIKKLWSSLAHKLLNSTDVKRDVHEMSEKDADEAALALKKSSEGQP